jgi:dTDP-4-dehydrorhamnose reductase
MKQIQKLIAFTGSSGILGTQLLKFKPENFQIMPVSLRDFNQAEFLKSFKSTLKANESSPILLNVAWPVRSHDYLISVENEVALQKSLQISKFFSEYFSSEIYGVGSILEVGNTHAVFDNSKVSPESLYAECKAKLHAWIEKNNPKSYKWFRVAYQVSYFDPAHKLIPSLLGNQRPFLRNPNAFRDYIHASDVARGIWNLLSSDLYGTSIVGTGRSISPFEIAMGLGVNPEIGHEVCKTIQTTFPEKLSKLGWVPLVSSPEDFKRKLEEERNEL